MLLNKLFNGEDLDEDEREDAKQAWRMLYRHEVELVYRSDRRVGIIKKVLRYALERIGAYEIDYVCVVLDWMDGLIWKVLEDEVEESTVCVDCEDDCENGEESG